MEKLLMLFMSGTLVGYLISAIFYIVSLKLTINKKIPTFFAILGLLFNTLALIARTMLAGNLPLSNLFEFSLFFLWCIVLIYLIVEFKFKMKALGVLVLPMCTIFTFWMTFILEPTKVSPLMPALRSPWLYFHVLTAVAAYGALAVSFAVAIIYLVKDYYVNKGEKNTFTKSFPDLERLEYLTYRIIFLAMPLLTLVIVTGAIWAEYAWGSYWRWDPKETWALITWIIYSVYLHMRLIGKWKGKKAIILTIVGFIAVIFTFLGVSYLLPGIHSYV